MKINFLKNSGVLVPASDIDEQRFKRFKSGHVYAVEIKLSRNSDFHGKMFAFLGFCYEHWAGDREFLSDAGQFDYFRKELTILAGFSDEYYSLDGSVRVEAKSLSYASMNQQQAEECYSAMINAAMAHIFVGCGVEVEQRLISFF